ncbi:MAG: hypothetical protein KDD04_12415, partial [Sinomicrobium sp.]|nr:hypothetical protein [Sinomicrobium sp.]
TPGPVVLRCRYGGPVAKFIGLFIFTIIWDGVVLILFKQDAPVWFKGVFGFFAVIITFAFGHSFLSLFNPRPVLQVSSKHARLGGSVNLNWKMRGQVQKIESFTITLIGQEEATYRRGTDTYTDRAVFHQQVMAEYLHGHIPPMGTCAIKIPRVSMHTWKSQNNKILWLIKVNGKIRKWPDINEEYEIMVLPY